MIFDNVRTETMNRGDMNAMLAACQLGRERFLRLVERYGAEIVMSAAYDWMDYSERDAARRRSRRSRTATYGPIVGWLDDDARNRDVRLRVETKVIVEGDEITIDLTGSNPEVPTGYNVPFEGSLLVACYYAVRTILLDEVTFPEHVPAERRRLPAGEGDRAEGDDLQPDTSRARASRASARRSASSTTSILALADALPEKVTGGQLGRHPLLRVRGLRRVGGRVLALPRGERGLVRRPLRQGRDGLGRQPDGEHAQQPDRGARHALPDALRPVRAAARAGGARASGAAGSGSSGATASSSTAPTRARATARPTRRAASSAAGTGSSRRAARTRTPPREEVLPAKVTGIPFGAGEFIEFREPNAAGYGDPLERDPAARARGRARRLHDDRARPRRLRRRLRRRADARDRRGRRRRRCAPSCGASRAARSLTEYFAEPDCPVLAPSSSRATRSSAWRDRRAAGGRPSTGRAVGDPARRPSGASARQYEQVADQLRELIVRGELQPGERLPNEAVLAARLRRQPRDRARGAARCSPRRA